MNHSFCPVLAVFESGQSNHVPYAPTATRKPEKSGRRKIVKKFTKFLARQLFSGLTHLSSKNVKLSTILINELAVKLMIDDCIRALKAKLDY